MSDRYSQLIGNPVGKFLADNLGLPKPVELDRHQVGDPVIEGRVLMGAAPGGRLATEIASVLAHAEATVETTDDNELRSAASEGDLDAGIWNPDSPDGGKFKALVFDASGITDSSELRALYDFFHPSFRYMERSGRVIVLGTPPEDAKGPREQTAQRALEGFVRSIAKEARAGTTAQLVYVAPKAEGHIGSTLRFLASPRSAFVSGQVVRVGKGEKVPSVDWDRPLAGQVALVTGASRGIGESIARTMARDGAHVVGLDIEPMKDELEAVMGEIGGSTLLVDVTDAEAPARICSHLSGEHGGVDIVVHNAGVTKDKTIVGMDESRWDVLLDINLSSQERINDALVSDDVLNPNSRIVCVSSIAGIAGNAGQTNYATSKAGVIGMVDSMAPVLAKAGATINAVAPGFIETEMTDAMPFATREVGRRINSLSQGGKAVDVAEAIVWFSSPASTGLNGNVVRVCGQSLVGA
ncbi:MAG: 3-oxoacyl-ACP reductase [Solirubrobacterales bacterium]